MQYEGGSSRSTVSRIRAWSVVVVFLVLVTVALLDRQAITLMVDPIKESYGISDAQMSLLQGAAFAIPFLIGTIPMGSVIDRFSPRGTICLAVLLWSAATIACALAESFLELLIARGLIGLGQAVLQPASWSIVARLFPAHRLSLAISVLSMGTQVGAAISFLLGGLLLSKAAWVASDALPLIGGLEPWRLVFLAAGAPGLVLALLIFIVPRSEARPDGKRVVSFDHFSSYLRENRAFLSFHALGFGFLCALVYGAAAWTPTLLLRTFSLDVRQVGLIHALTAVPVGVAGFLFNGWAADRSFAKGRDDAHFRHFEYVSIALALVGGIGFSMGTEPCTIITCFVLTSFLQPFSGVAAAALQIATPAELRGRASALFSMFYNAFGMIVGPSVVALLADNLEVGRSLGIAIALNFAIFGGASAFCFWRGREYATRSIALLRSVEPA
jgi:MFS family permease